MVHMKKIIKINLEKKRLELGLTGGGEDALRRYLWRGGLGIEHSTLVGSDLHERNGDSCWGLGPGNPDPGVYLTIRPHSECP